MDNQSSTTAAVPLNRRQFLHQGGTATLCLGLAPLVGAASTSDRAAGDLRIVQTIAAHHPSRLKKLPGDFRDRVGTTHVAGKYCLTDQPYLLEGAEKLLEMGKRLGKFWLNPNQNPASYPFHSQLEPCRTLVELARTRYFSKLFALPFRTLILEAPTPAVASPNAAEVDRVADLWRGIPTMTEHVLPQVELDLIS